MTLVYEGIAFPERGVSYAFSDLRTLPYRDNFFDTVVSISTLEHVGMDNTGYGSTQPRAADPAGEVDQAARELTRVLAPGGMLLVSVPYGHPQDHGWLRQFSRADVERLIGAVGPRHADVPSIDTGTPDGRSATSRRRATRGTGTRPEPRLLLASVCGRKALVARNVAP